MIRIMRMIRWMTGSRTKRMASKFTRIMIKVKKDQEDGDAKDDN